MTEWLYLVAVATLTVAWGVSVAWIIANQVHLFGRLSRQRDELLEVLMTIDTSSLYLLSAFIEGKCYFEGCAELHADLIKWADMIDARVIEHRKTINPGREEPPYGVTTNTLDPNP